MQDRPIAHFTDHSNLPGILTAGGIYCDSTMTNSGAKFTECADEGIKGGRRSRKVNVPPGGVVADYVPFYYATRSPMMSAISNGKVPNYTSNDNLIYLVSSLNAVHSANLKWVCSNGNARAIISEFFNKWDDLENNIDWPLMKARHWANTVEDGDRKRRRAAEFLVYQFFPFDLVRAIIVKSERVAKIVREQVAPALAVQVNPDHYI